MSESSRSMPFPTSGLIPKRETGALEFLRKYPDFDGRGIKMCIMDSGVDPGADGLQVTSTGSAKIIDILDASGAGDIDTSKICELDTDGCICGLSGRQLKIPPEWKCVNGKFHVGLVRLFSLVSEDYHDSWKKARKLQRWTAQHSEIIAETMRTIASTNDAGIKEDLEAQQEVLKSLDEKYEDLGPVLDLVVFFDGSQWWAALDTSESGDLSQSTLLTNYRDQLKYATYGGIYQINYTLNILEEGNRVELVIPQEHGTHVACIAAGNFPDNSDKNGIAPGCQIISIKIGHTLLDGSNETGTSLVRAFLYCMKNGIDIVNISYNEPYNWCDGGRVFEAIEMAVKEYGMIVCVAAGNAGPGLTTVGSLPASHYTLGVGAYVTPDMMTDLYGLTHKHPPLMYNWTSRGPTLDGDFGVNICAPGGAIASIPTYALRNSSLFNGTSMACPNACGSIAIVLCGLRSKSIPWSPFSVRRAVENTAKKLDASADARLSHGAGLVQCSEAFDWLVKYANEAERHVDFQISTEGGSSIYIRNAHQLSDSIYVMTVDAVFPKKSYLYPELPKFNLSVILSSPENWIRSSEYLSISSGKKTFKVELKLNGLRPGVHSTVLSGIDAKNVDKGPLFQIPVTVCVPETKAEWTVVAKDVLHKPGQPVRRFIEVPLGATWAEWRLQLVDYNDDQFPSSSQLPVDANPILNFEYHAIQFASNAQYKTHMFRESAAMPKKRVVSCVFPVFDRLGLLELSVALFWNRVSSAFLDWTLEFHGLKPTMAEMTYLEGEAFYRVDVDCGQRSEYLLPSTTFTHLVQPLRPTEWTLSPLTCRDTWPDGRITYQNILQYQFKLEKAATVEATCPILMDYLYENEIEGQMWKLYDCNKRLLRCGEARVMRKIDFTAKLCKGEFTIQLQLRHDNRKLLEKFQDVVMHLRRKLPTPALSCETSRSYLSALRDSSEKYRGTVLAPNQSDFFFLVPPVVDKVGKAVHGSYFLDGWMYFALGKDQVPDAKRNAGAFKLKYLLTEPANIKKNSINKNAAKDKPSDDNPEDPVLLHQVVLLDKLGDMKKCGNYYQSLVAEAKGTMQLVRINHAYLLSLCKAWENFCKKSDKSADVQTGVDLTASINSTVDSIISTINQKDLLAAVGSQSECGQDEEKQHLELRKSALIEALYQKCLLLIRQPDQETEDKLTLIIQDLSRLLDAKTDMRLAEINFQHSLRRKQLGKALKFSLQIAEEKSSSAKYKDVIDTARLIGWPHVADYLQAKLPVLFPAKYDLF